MRKKKREAEAQSAAPAAAPGAKPGGLNAGRLTPMDIQQVEFGRGFKGYDEREVDEFLDRLTEDFAAALDENQRLRNRDDAGLGAVGTAAATDATGANRESEQILGRARAEAAQIVRAAEARAAKASPATPAATGPQRAAVMAFLNTEREFLKNLAGLVQGHVDEVKGMASTSLKPVPANAAKPAGSPKPAPTAATQAARATPATATGSSTQDSATPPEQNPAETARQPSAAPGQTQPMPTVNVPDSPQTTPAESKRAAPASAPTESGDKQDGSLRELFWGED